MMTTDNELEMIRKEISLLGDIVHHITNCMLELQMANKQEFERLQARIDYLEDKV